MASGAGPSLGSCPAPLKATETKEEGSDSTPRRLSEHDHDLISNLPVLEGPLTLREYQGFWLPEAKLPGILATLRDFKPRPDQLLLCTYPKSGTTWLKALTFATATRAHYPLAHDDHPLLRLNPHDCVGDLNPAAGGQGSDVEASCLPSPRILSTHMPFPLLPDSVARSGCRIVYVCRDPKDVVVSEFYYSKHIAPEAAGPLQLGWFLERFCEGKSPVGPIWEHVLGYWKESLRRPQEVLFFKYEEMLQDPAGHVKRLAEFAGCPFSAEEEEEGVVEEIVGLCSFEKLKGLEVNKTGRPRLYYDAKTNAGYFRKGAVGDWRNHMTPEMAKRLDEIVLRKIEGSGLTLPGVG